VAIGGGTVSSLVVGAATSSVVDKTITYGGGTGQVAIISVHNVAAGVTSVAINFSATEWSCAIVAEESGLATSANLDQVNATAQGGGLTTWTSGNVTTTQASEVAYGFSFVPNGASLAFVPAAGWVALSGTGISSGQVFDATDGLTLFGIRQALSSTGTYAASGTGPNDQYTSGIATYKTATGGSCTHAGYTSAGATATPNGTTGSYWLKNGSFGTPDCSTVNYWAPALGNFTVN